MIEPKFPKDLIKQELLRRSLIEGARKNFITFSKLVFGNYKVGQHHLLMADCIHKIEAGAIKRLMVSMPPRHGKSTAMSQIFPCFHFGRNPTRDIMQVGYSDDISTFHSRHARRIFGSERYADIFPGVARRVDEATIAKQSVHEWTTLHGGRYRASGILSGISGRGAHVIIIDDPVKNREEANSQGVREKVMQEYRSTLYTRLDPDGVIIIVMTRWHPKDLAGTLLEEMTLGGEQWTVLNLPAINENGDALWPEQWPIDRLLQVKKAIGPNEFEALYQQNPRFQEGALFRRESFGDILDAPTCPIIETVRVWDRSSTSTSKSDWTAGVRIGKDEHGMLYVLDVIRMKGDPFEVTETIKATARRDGPACQIGLFEDPGSAGDFELIYMIRELAGYSVVPIPQTKAKEIRAKPASIQVKSGNVKIVRGEWNGDFLDEMELFFDGDHDDQADAFCSAVTLLALGAEGLRENNYMVGDSIGPIMERPIFTPSQTFRGTGFR